MHLSRPGLPVFWGLYSISFDCENKTKGLGPKKKKKKLTPYEPEDHFAFLYGFLVQTKNYTVVHRDLFM